MEDSTELFIAFSRRLDLWRESPQEDHHLDKILDLLPWLSTDAATLNVSQVNVDLCQVSQCLVLLLSEIMTGSGGVALNASTLLAGFQRYDVWKYCLATESDTFNLACCILYYVENHKNSDSGYPAEDTAALALINAWLGVDSPWDSLPGAREIACRLYGDNWCTMMHAPPEDNYGLPFFVESYMGHPPFLYGLCPVQDAIVELPLPLLDCMP